MIFYLFLRRILMNGEIKGIKYVKYKTISDKFEVSNNTYTQKVV